MAAFQHLMRGLSLRSEDSPVKLNVYTHVLQFPAMKDIKWDLSKSEKLKVERGVSFEEIMQSKLIGALEHPKRHHQKIMLFEHKNYIWVVPYVERGNEIFLKTLFASRKYTKIWKRGKIL